MDSLFLQVILIDLNSVGCQEMDLIIIFSTAFQSWASSTVIHIVVRRKVLSSILEYFASVAAREVYNRARVYQVKFNTCWMTFNCTGNKNFSVIYRTRGLSWLALVSSSSSNALIQSLAVN